MANTEKVLDNRATRVRKLSGLNRREFCDKYGLTYRTYEYWERGFNPAPEYVMDLLENVVRLEKKMPYVYRIVDTSDGDKTVEKTYMASIAEKKVQGLEATAPGRYKLILATE